MLPPPPISFDDAWLQLAGHFTLISVRSSVCSLMSSSDVEVPAGRKVVSKRYLSDQETKFKTHRAEDQAFESLSLRLCAEAARQGSCGSSSHDQGLSHQAR